MQQNSDVAGRQYPRNSDFDRFQMLMSVCELNGAELARRVDVHPNTVSAWSTGSRAVPGAVIAYLDLLAKVKQLTE